MSRPMFAAVAAILLACAAARAQEKPPVAGSEPPAAEKTQPCQPGQTKKPAVKRRSVRQQVGSVLAPEPWGPVPQPRAPLAVTPPPLVRPAPPNQPMPAQVNSCDPGGCTDTSGVRYNGGVGNAVIGPGGRLCTQTGTTIQCF